MHNLQANYGANSGVRSELFNDKYKLYSDFVQNKFNTILKQEFFYKILHVLFVCDTVILVKKFFKNSFYKTDKNAKRFIALKFNWREV